MCVTNWTTTHVKATNACHAKEYFALLQVYFPLSLMKVAET